MRSWPVGLVVWLVVLAAAELAGFAGLLAFFVRSEHGQLLDTVALAGNSVGQARISSIVDTVLNAISAASLVVATAVVGFIALIRRRIAVAVAAILLIVGANLTTQVLKQIINRPELGVDAERAAAGNSMPSGHTTIVAAVAVALVLVLPAQRGVAAVIGAFLTTVAGVATLSAGWHRPSDAVAALLIVGAWAAAAGVFIIVAQRRHGGVEYGEANQWATAALAVAGVVFLTGAAVAMVWTNQVLSIPTDELGRRRLLIAYAGGAAGIASAASLLLASVLVTVHRVVPRTVSPTVAAHHDRHNW